MAFIEAGNASEAYRKAYDASRMKPETINRKAAELMGNGKITARVDELKAEHRERHRITTDSLVSDLVRIRKAAERDGQLAVARQSVMDVAKLMGLVIEKGESRINLAGELTTEKAVMILQSLGINPEVSNAKN